MTYPIINSGDAVEDAKAYLIAQDGFPVQRGLIERLILAADDYRERLHGVVEIEAEAEACGGRDGFMERRAKAWDRAREPFEMIGEPA